MHAIKEISHPLATIWFAREECDEADYYYGGTRLIESNTSKQGAVSALLRLAHDESGIKNRLINRAIRLGALDEFRTRLPAGFLESVVYGARCVIQPRTDEVARALADSLHPQNSDMLSQILETVGNALKCEPRIKLTPDFGRYAGLADILHQYTPNVLGVRCEVGGCGGKSSYSTTGVIAGLEQSLSMDEYDGPVTCIGSAGAMGLGVFDYFLKRKVDDLAACDIQYDVPHAPGLTNGTIHLKSKVGMFTDECLMRGGVIVATTFGDELEKSGWHLIPEGSVLLLAHNIALPEGKKGISLARSLNEKGVLVIPGQVLTLGGALTARMEWFWRLLPDRPDFDKALAHQVVHRTVSYIVSEMLSTVKTLGITPHESMLKLVA